nr:MutA' [Streptococcus mutans]
MLAAQSFDIGEVLNMLNTQLLELFLSDTLDVREDLFDLNITDTAVIQSNDSPDTRSRVGSHSICPPRKTSASFNSYCC